MLMVAVDHLRGVMDVPFPINSGYRTPARNRRVGGAPGSFHVKGLAIDISTKHMTTEQRMKLVINARKMGFRGIGIARTYIHLDMGNRDAAWVYTSEGIKGVPVGNEALYV